MLYGYSDVVFSGEIDGRDYEDADTEEVDGGEEFEDDMDVLRGYCLVILMVSGFWEMYLLV